MTFLYFVSVVIGLLFQRRKRVGNAKRPPEQTDALVQARRASAERAPRSSARYPFPLDHFQLEALDALDAGHHVVVAAPTGSGKTVVAEYGIETHAGATAGGRSTPRRSRRCRTRSSATSASATDPARSGC